MERNAVISKFQRTYRGAKVDARNSLTISNLVTLAKKKRHEVVDNRIFPRPRTSGSRGSGRNLDNSIASRQFNVDYSPIVCHLKKLGKVRELAVWVPYELSDDSKAKCPNSV
ncbi:hypothetical protein TNCV_3311771 [Trichonephila clavipes]|nr:hypothetical protein TNCV_3311771 [Trichonephila clavipes]